MIDVVWVSNHPDTILARGYWDQTMLEGLFDHCIWKPPGMFTFEHHVGFDALPEARGAIVVVPARHHVNDIDWLNAHLQRLPWLLLILTGDEERVFPWRDVVHPNMRIWAQTPGPVTHAGVHRVFGDGYAPHLRPHLRPEPQAKSVPISFSGQVNTPNRERCVEFLRPIEGAVYEPTGGFSQTHGRERYVDLLSRSKIVVAPSGPETPDTFRLFEALEVGAIPIADTHTCSRQDKDYWPLVFQGAPPFPVVQSWSELPVVVKDLLDSWPANANRVFAWWQGYKRQQAWWLADDITALAGEGLESRGAITVLVPTSPVPLNPGMEHIEETLASIRERLPDSEILVMIDGVNPSVEHRRDDYEEFTRRLLWLCNHMHNVLPIVYEEHLHQAEMTRRALEMVRTECVLFVEHDTPLQGDIEWEGLVRAVASGRANVVRLHHEASVLEPHKHLMLDESPQIIEGVPLLRTAQWSQRPHLASKEFYGWILDKWFGPDTKTMIEDRFYGVVDSYWKAYGEQGWEKFKLWLYAPEGDMKRSGHTDARENDPKGEMVYPFWDGPWADG